MSITDFLNARIAEDEAVARALLADLSAQIEEDHAGEVDEKGPMTPARLLSAQLWAHYDGQSKRRSFAKGQQIATLANPARVLAECAAKRAIVELHQPYEIVQRMAHGDIYPCLECGSVDDAVVEWPCRTLRTLAAVYADHPAHLDEWRVGA